MSGDPHDVLGELARKLEQVQAQLDGLKAEMARLQGRATGTRAPSEGKPAPPTRPGSGLTETEATDDAKAEPPREIETTGEIDTDSEVEEVQADDEIVLIPAKSGPSDFVARIAQRGDLILSTTPDEPRPDTAQHPAGRPTSSKPGENLEALIGANWIGRIGVLILLLAGGFLAHLAWQQNWVNPTIQVAAIFLSGVGLLIAGEVTGRRSLPILSQGLTALGIFALYGGGLVGHHLHGILSLNATFVLYIITTAVSFALAARSGSVAVVLLGMLGGYLTPVILSTGQDAPVALFTYLAFLNAGIAATAIARRWDFLSAITLAATALMFLAWYVRFYEPARLWTLQWMLSLHAGVLVAWALFPHAALRRATTRWLLWILSTTSLAYFGVTYSLFREIEGHRLGEFAAALGAGYWAAAGLIYALRRKPERLIAYLLALGAIFVTTAVPIYFSADARGIAWSVQALVFTVIGLRYRSARTIWGALAVYALAIGWTAYHDIGARTVRGELWVLDARFATALLVSTFLAGGGLACWLARARVAAMPALAEPRLGFLLSAVADLVLGAAAIHQFPGQWLAIAWTANALAVCMLGRLWRSAAALWFGAILFAPAIGRFVQFQLIRVADYGWEQWRWGLDRWFVDGLIVVAVTWLAAWIVREKARWRDLPDRGTLLVLAGYGLLYPVLWIQHGGWTLTSLWALTALGLATFARWQRLPKTAGLSSLGFLWVFLWWLMEDYQSGDALTRWPTTQAGLLSGLALVSAGFLAGWLYRNREPAGMSGYLTLATNLALLFVLDCQWTGYTLLALWALDVAILWALGFAWRHAGARTEALCLWVILLGGWILRYGWRWSEPLEEFTPVSNPRFGALCLVSAIGLAATWAYRRYPDRPATEKPGEQSTDAPGKVRRVSGNMLRDGLDESRNHLLCVILANLLLVAAMTLEIHTLFARYADAGEQPFANMSMAYQAAISILWGAYATVMFIAGFLARYTPVRILAMVGLAIITLKVLTVDLRDLDVIYRVLSFAVVGVLFLGVSYLYQRYKARILGEITGAKP